MKKYFFGFLSGVIALYAVPIFASNVSFPDVSLDAWYHGDVMNMVEWGVIKGNDDGTFAPTNNVNRAELSAMWNRYEDHIADEYYSKKEVDRKFAKLEEKLDITTANYEEKVDLTDVVDQWSPIVGFILCDFRYSDTNNQYLMNTGSGTLVADGDDYFVITNEHIMDDGNGNSPTACLINFPDMDEEYYYTSSIELHNIKFYDNYDTQFSLA